MNRAQDQTNDSLQELYELCAELKQTSPHPSRPQIPNVVADSTWSKIHGLFGRVLAKEAEDIVAEDERAAFTARKCDALSDLCIFVRNAAAMDPTNQISIDNANIATDIRQTVLSMLAHELLCPEAMKCAAIAAQTLSNAVTGNVILQRKALEKELASDPLGGTTVYWKLLASIHQKTNMAGLVLVLNTINGDPELVELLCTASPGQQLVRKLGTLFGNIQDDRSEEKDLLYTILSKVIEHSCISILVSKDPTLETYGLYEALAVYCKIRHADNADCAGSIFDKRLVQSFSKILEQTHSVLSGLWHVSAPGKPAACNDVNMESAMAAHRCLTAILSVLETVTLSHSQRLADLAIECKLAHRIVELLGLLNINLPRIQRLGSQSTDESQTTSIERLFMFKRDLIQIIGNLAYKNTRMQDLMRELDGLSLVLDNMRIDDNHPFIKEYAIVALKWLLENNQASHDYVRSIEDGKPVLDPSISTSGLQVNMDDKGKISSSANKADK